MMFGDYSIGRMTARAKMNDLRRDAQVRRLSKMLRGGRPSSLQRWAQGVQRAVKSILP